MNHQEIRKKFIDFFKERGHTLVSSSSLLPDDPSVLFTTAGMQQFKKYYLDLDSPYGDRVTSVQKCLRTSDIENVGDNSHLTFLEMLGNFSFKYPEAKDSYFKKEAIKIALELFIKEFGVPLDRIKISVFKGSQEDNIPADNESLEIWKSLGIPEDKIFFGDKEDNFWGPTGDKGPCGPTTEIYVDGVEIWNIVFNEYYCDKEKNLTPLTRKGIDTGMGFERLTAALQGVENVFETELFIPIIEEIRGKNLYAHKKNTVSERIIADHLRASVFLIADGVLPSNTEQGYILRRLLRRAIRYAKLLNLPEDIYEQVFHVISHDIYGEIYPELKSKEKEILEVLLIEKEKFSKTLDKGLREFGKVIDKITASKEKTISGEDAFNLYTTFGFPIELIEELARERGLTIDTDGFKKELEAHKEKSRKGAEKKFGGHGLLLDTGELKAGTSEEIAKVTKLHTATHLLHTALRNMFGPNIKPRGSDITAERLRFDFTFPRKLTDNELKELEENINNVIKKDLKVTMEEMPYEKAIESGALAFFKGKYPEKVKVYSIGPSAGSGQVYSKEVCGGPHIEHTDQAGKIKITKEESASAGIRRIRATFG